MADTKHLAEEGPDGATSRAPSPHPEPDNTPPGPGLKRPAPPSATRLNRLPLIIAAAIMSVTLLVVAFFVGDSTDGEMRDRRPQEQVRRPQAGPAQAMFMDTPPVAAEEATAPFTGPSAEPATGYGAQDRDELTRARAAYAAQQEPPPVYAPGAGAAVSRSIYAADRPEAQAPAPPSPEAQALARAMHSSLTPRGLDPRAPARSALHKAAETGEMDSLDAAYLNTLGQIQNLYRTTASTVPGAGVGGDAPEMNDAAGASPGPVRGGQAFLRQAAQSREGSNYLAATMQQPMSPFEIREGTLVEAFLLTGIHSDLPGEVIAQVSRNVYDSGTQQVLLIPKGARLIGTYDNQIALDQSRLLVAWTRLVFPDGRSVNLPGLASKDMQGASGLSGEVNRHYWSAFGGAMMLAVVGGGLTYATSRTRQPGGAYGYPSPGEIAAGSVATELSRVATERLRGSMNRRPTIQIREGTPFSIFMNGDLVLPPYQPQDGFLQRVRLPEVPLVTRDGY